MTPEFITLLQLIGGKEVDKEIISSKKSLHEIERLAESQGVWTLIFPELEKYVDMSDSLNKFMMRVIEGIQRTEFQLRTIVELNKEGYKICLLKGASVAALYPHPEYRVSGDTDVLINLEDEESIISFLGQKGYIIEKREKNDHHFKAYHSIGGLLEGHVRLYSISTEKILLDGLDLYNEDFVSMNIEGYEVPVLGFNDGLMYLTAHYIKHLVNEGGGIRQMLDLLIYIDHYKDKLDFERYYFLLKKLRYDKLLEVIQTIGAKFWGFKYPIKYEELADRLLSDSEAGGIFGFDTDSRQGFYREYCKKRSNSSMAARAIMLIGNERGFVNRIFPSQNELLNNDEYKYAKNKLLVPLAWMHRFVRILNNKSYKEMNKQGLDQRMSLMKELNMLN